MVSREILKESKCKLIYLFSFIEPPQEFSAMKEVGYLEEVKVKGISQEAQGKPFHNEKNDKENPRSETEVNDL